MAMLRKKQKPFSGKMATLHTCVCVYVYVCLCMCVCVFRYCQKVYDVDEKFGKWNSKMITFL